MFDEKFHNKYRIKSIRLSGWDYSQNGWYFVTICIRNQEYLFGEINAGKTAVNIFIGNPDIMITSSAMKNH